MKFKMCLIVDQRNPCHDPRPTTYFDWIDEDEDYMRVSEVTTVDFDMLPDEVVVPKQVEAFDKAIAAKRAELNGVIAILEERKAKLLALTHEA